MRQELLAGTVMAMLAFGPSVATAQQAEVAGGYAFVRDLDAEENLSAGWFASVAVAFTKSVSAVGEVSGSYQSEFDFSQHAYLGGVRFHHSGVVTPFAQVLVGALHASNGEGVTKFVVQPGGGVDFHVSDAVAVRTGVDFRNVFIEEQDAQQFRWYAGLVAKFGK